MAASTFPQRLRRAREIRALTQRELGRRAGLSETHISTLERRPGKNVTNATVTTLADALGVEIGWLGSGRGSPPVAIASSRTKRSPRPPRARAAHVVRRST